MKITKHIASLTVGALIVTASCASCAKSKGSAAENVAAEPVPTAKVEFSGDSAYRFVSEQCDFGPRVPGTKAHQQCGDYLVAKLQGYGAEVIEQTAPVTTFDGTKLTLRNIVAQYNTQAETRVLLLAHWDSRPWADNDADESKRTQPVMGANDGASGVGVLLELARLMSQQKPNVGVDILLVDVEDWGNTDDDDSWALGAQYWASNPHVRGYSAAYAILLDMVGDSEAHFRQEYFSTYYAKQVVDMVWAKASEAGYGNMFPKQMGGAVTDDHVPINKMGIPCIDIIHMEQSSGNGFFPYWHTTHDTMEHIDKAPLKAVGQTVADVIYQY